VIIQTNDGQVRNSLFYRQVAAAKEAGVPWGVYTFVEAQSGTGQADTALSMSNGRGRTLGVWADTEVPGAYQQACSFTGRARRVAFIVGVYASPGNWPGDRCTGYAWPAEWGGGGAYPLAGYPYSAIKIRQSCGTCRLSGFSGAVDLDEDLGLLALAQTPTKPTPAARARRELEADYRLRTTLRYLLTRRHCRATPTRGYSHACRVWLGQGVAVNRTITRIHQTYHIY
jgi:hypothetical protein